MTNIYEDMNPWRPRSSRQQPACSDSDVMKLFMRQSAKSIGLCDVVCIDTHVRASSLYPGVRDRSLKHTFPAVAGALRRSAAFTSEESSHVHAYGPNTFFGRLRSSSIQGCTTRTRRRGLGFTRAPNDQINIGILPNMISGIALILRLETRM